MRYLIPIYLLALSLSSMAAAPIVIWPPPPQAPAGTPIASFPTVRTDWLGRFQANIDQARATHADLIFDGDCITDFWQRDNVFQKRYANYHAANFAIDWDHVQNVLWRVQHGELEGLAPKLIVVALSTHNNGGYSATDFAAGIKALVAAYRQAAPNAHVLLLGIFPTGATPDDGMRMRIKDVNQAISQLGDANVTFLDLGPKFLRPDGTLATDLLKDDATATPAGYAVWADAIQPIINQYCPATSASASDTASAHVIPITPVTPITWPLPPIPPGSQETTYPVPRTDWYTRYQGNLDKLPAGPYDLVFDGDSITDNWQGPGQDVWKQRYGAIKAIDIAIGGDQVQHLLWRVQHGDLEGQNPKLIVLMIGTNNGGQPPQDIAAGIKVLLGEYETRCPAAHILLLGVFPRGPEANTSTHQWVQQINAILSTYDSDPRVTYMDIGQKFLQPDGTLTAEIMPDFLHPSAKGYVIWADAIAPVIAKYFPAK
jgi:lysophospholipase L1-like esterase